LEEDGHAQAGLSGKSAILFRAPCARKQKLDVSRTQLRLKYRQIGGYLAAKTAGGIPIDEENTLAPKVLE
jgi:hypothetical protein